MARRRKAAKVEGLAGASAVMAEVRRVVSRAAAARTTVLLTGETGVGKERVARAIHESTEAPGPWVAVNCGALPAELAESLLFGHAKGAFTGADSARPGKVREAHGGTLFLDEVAELPPPLQVKLLRVLQEREVEPLGLAPEAVDVRVVAATHKDLREEVEGGRFREDLYYRLAVLTLEVPPLRERPEDVPALVEALLPDLASRAGRGATRLAPALVEYLAGCRWPGNVRELANVLESMLVMSDADPLGLGDLPARFRKESFLERFEMPSPSPAPEPGGEGPALAPAPPPGPEPVGPLKPRVDAYERRLVVEALAAFDGRKKDAAEALGISARAMSYYLKKHELS